MKMAIYDPLQWPLNMKFKGVSSSKTRGEYGSRVESRTEPNRPYKPVQYQVLTVNNPISGSKKSGTSIMRFDSQFLGKNQIENYEPKNLIRNQ